MSLKYWEFEDAPYREKLKNPRIRDIAMVFFDNETTAYRFATLLSLVKKNRGLRLRELPDTIPLSTAARYLDFGVEIGMLKHENETYELTDRYTRPLRNLAAYIKAWALSEHDDDVELQFANARFGKQRKRGGRRAPAAPHGGAPAAALPEAAPGDSAGMSDT